ncbi:hypothetical protein Tsp_10188 [Trichinella spiralis]|uniref:hypothetical protein n=1 Tax=Trichinella spiralis TaxID=6334 RepID=UPI0001EFDDD7|nr:hypothetical protein Tsp_10188 [Trichinella spiralis]
MTTVEGESLFRSQNGDVYRITSHPGQQSDHEQKLCTVKTETEQQSSGQTTTSTCWTASSSVDDSTQRNGLIVSSSELKIKVKVKQEPQDAKFNARKQQIPPELAETSTSSLDYIVTIAPPQFIDHFQLCEMFPLFIRVSACPFWNIRTEKIKIPLAQCSEDGNFLTNSSKYLRQIQPTNSETVLLPTNLCTSGGMGTL